MPPRKKEADSTQSLEDVLKDLRTKSDLNIAPYGSVAKDVVTITTGSMAINEAIGVGGYPIGRISEFWGPPASGKTSLAIQIAAAAQREIISNNEKNAILYVDFEQAMDPDYTSALGVDINHPSFLFVQPDFMEQGLEGARRAIATGQIKVAIFDSVAAMVPEAIANQEVGSVTVALQARIMSMFLRQLVPMARATGCSPIFINHEMTEVNMGGAGRPAYLPPKKTTNGGTALKFYASIRIHFSPGVQYKSKVYDPVKDEHVERFDGADVKVKIVKNKVAPPFRECVVRTRFGHGFDNFWTAYEVLASRKLVRKATGGYIRTKDPELFPDGFNGEEYELRSEDAMLRESDVNSSLRNKWITKAEQLVAQSKANASQKYNPNAEELAEASAEADDVEDS